MTFNTLKQSKRIIAIVLAAFLASTIFVIPTFAAGGAYVSDTYVEVAEGGTVSIQLNASNAAGTFSVGSDGCASANGGGWLESGEPVTIDIFGNSVGSGTVTINFTDFVTFDEETITDPIVISVNVYAPDGGYNPDKGQNEGGDTAQPEEETTTADPAEEKLKVTVDGAEYVVVKDLSSIEAPKGFTETDGTYNGETIKVYSFGKDLTLYVLKKADDGSVIFRTYNETSKKFEAPKTIEQNKITYYLLDVPADETAPEGYTAKDLKIADYTVKGYVADEKSYEDFYYIRALADGTLGYYSYDVKQGSIQRCMSLEESLNSNELIKAAQEEAQKAVEKAAKTAKLLKMLLLAAGVVILGLIAAVIVLAVKNGKNKKNGPKAGSGNDNGADDSEREYFDGAFEEDPIVEAEDIPEGVNDLNAYELEIENLIEENRPDPWKELGMREDDI